MSKHTGGRGMQGRASLVIACLALFFSLTGASMAATGYRITSLWQIAPQVRHALKGARGPQGQTGAVGPVGPQGPPGAQGPAGPAGMLSGVTAQSLVRQVPAGETINVIAACDNGRLISGGYDSGPGLTVLRSEPLPYLGDASGPSYAWRVTVENTTTAPLSATAYAMCAR